MKTKINLCDICKFNFADCKSTHEMVEYGDGIGNDNIIKCPIYQVNIEDIFPTMKECEYLPSNFFTLAKEERLSLLSKIRGT